MTTEQYIRLGRRVALLSTLCGTLIFGTYWLTMHSGLLFVGYAFILLAGITNLFTLALLLIRAGRDQPNRGRLLKTCAILFLNIPLMTVYCLLALIRLQTIEIQFSNDTGSELSDIRIIGCSGGYISRLPNGKSATRSLSITGDCSLFIDYLYEGQRQKEEVLDYVTPGMGQKVHHQIKVK